MVEKRCFACMNKMLGEVCSCEESKKERGIYPDALKPGTRLKKDFGDYQYILGHVMGAGGFGIVYVAWDEVNDCKVAIKEFFPREDARRSATDYKKVVYDTGKEDECEAWKNKFFQEALRLGKLSNEKHIVSIIDQFTENNTAYIVMDYINGITLSNYLKAKEVFTEEQICQLMRPVLESMARIHQKGIIHRDISPDNIMVSMGECGNSNMVLIDFGAANSGNSTRLASRVVRDSFSAPELYSGQNIGPWSDVYSLCATIYFCLTGQTPLEARYRKEENKELVKPNDCPKIEKTISSTFEEAIIKGLSINRLNRQQSIEELMVDLGMKADVTVPKNDSKEVNVGEEIEIKEENTAATKGKTKKTKRNAIVAGIIVATLLVGCLVLMVLGNQDGYRNNPVSENDVEESDSDEKDSTDKKDKDNPKVYDKNLVLENITVTYEKLTSSIGKKTEKIEFKGCSFEEGALQAFDTSMPKLYSISFIDCTGADYSEIDFSVYEELYRLSFINSGIDDVCVNAFAGSERKIDNIRYLIIREPEIKDYSFINQITSLYFLDICSNSIAMNSQDVGGECRISELRLGGYSENVELLVDTIEAISSMSSLYGVKFENMIIPEELEEHLIPMFADLERLEEVDVSNCNLKSLNMLSGASQLKVLIADNNELTNLDPLERLIRLEKLSICDSRLTDISGLKNCTILRNVCLRNNNIADISVLAKSAATIQMLDVSENVLLFSGENSNTVQLNKTTIESLQELDRLNISNIGFLGDVLTLNAKEIAILHADGCGLMSIKNEAGFDNIMFADISNNMISDKTVIENFKNASTLIASNNEFTSLGSVSDVNVRNLVLTGNNLSELPQFGGKNTGYIITFDYNEKITTQVLEWIKARYTYKYINNVPLDKQVAYENILYSSFVTFDENQVETNNYISRLKANSINDLFNERLYYFDDVELVKN